MKQIFREQRDRRCAQAQPGQREYHYQESCAPAAKFRRGDELHRSRSDASIGQKQVDQRKQQNKDRQAAHRKCSEGQKAKNRRSEEHTSELQSLMRISYAVFCLQKQKKK